ncbi:tetratricopeptide repeat protein [Kibdelosporangium persicum]|uniref:DNA-binding transcriptional activator of the SARP family n=1 Tax=Kibdelosporangium persicum TaxID=2698649 RepID=A0ABX2F3R0_9PSEU|nr:tetratricopeptide repeat protein [Kibdelosporangium persicum]NRN65937.1 DNA-binding transcriptional activator of the SARP family [Kibdelosporangium persicum]
MEFRVPVLRDLPRDTPSFTGREDLLARLDRLTGPAIVAIDGPPGAGKTALVTHWARTRHHRFRDGVLYADLQGYAMGPPEDPAIVMTTFLNVLGATAPASTEERAAVLRHLLADREVLVFLDNVRDSSHVQPLLAALTPCPVIITSRQQLTKLVYHEGAERLTVGPLSEDAAKELLFRRIGSRCWDSPEAVAALATLCARLPLALRIVSEHVAARDTAPIEDLVADLRDAGRLLDAGPHGDDVTTSLRTVFSWSHRALSAHAARLFQCLGLHPTPRFSAQAAAAVSGLGHEHVHRALDDLIGAHLIQQSAADRYFLHDMIHAYAADLAASDPESPAALRRLVDWYLRTATNARKHLIPDDHPVPLLQSDVDLRPRTFGTGAQALRWCLDERSTLVAVTRLAARHGLHNHTWRLAAAMEGLADRFIDLDQQVDVFELGHESATRVGNMKAAAGNLNNLGKALISLRRLDEAQQCFEWALPIFHEEADRYGAAIARHNLGTIRLLRGDPRRAITVYEEVLTEFVEMEKEWSQGHVHQKLGDCRRALDQLDEAARCYHLALALRTKINDVRGQGITLAALAQLNVAQGNVGAAIDYCEASLRVHRQTADQANTAQTLCTLATALTDREPSQAAAHAQAAVDIYRDLNPHEHAKALTVLAAIHEKTGDLANARDTWALVHRTLVALGDPDAAEAERQLRAIERAMSGIPDPRPDSTKIVDSKDNS